ncbi:MULTISPECIES: SDR family NAD(P)-dependent oxidoreductase [unclassified Streptomyces]|uniref:SDR family NAD(P)-dependent oxidoreductase n=1 Tax=unclassified Streptomyces TaxID=2593676 RepID=UPI00278C1D81|nr:MULTISPECIES: SDR family NAD(P)-dependent oxidoreductase [unclassified Streptomyces]
MTSTQQRTAVVTGAGAPRGLGRATALRLAADGWAVAVLDLDEAAAKTVAEEIAATGATAFAHHVDVADEPSVLTARAAVAAEVEAGRLPMVGAVVNIAGITSPVPFLETTLELWNRIMAVNATGTYLVTKAFLPGLIEAGWGRIVNMSSVSAQQGGGVFGRTPYSAAKAAILGLTKSLARELGAAGVTVNAVAPGAADTDIRAADTNDRLEAAITSGVPLGRQATAEEIAGVIAWLTTEDAGYLQGTTIDINGGSYLH